ncbi:hypothetical protein NKH77_44500 [Streptomyces sp. M19]
MRDGTVVCLLAITACFAVLFGWQDRTAALVSIGLAGIPAARC